MRNDLTFREWFGLPHGQGRALASLYEAGGSPVSRDALLAAGRLWPSSMNFTLSMIRMALGPGAIENVPNRGWRLTNLGLAECRAAIAGIQLLHPQFSREEAAA